MRTATAHSDLDGDDGRMLRQLRALQGSYEQAGWRQRLHAWELRWHRHRLRKLMTPR